MQTVKFSDKEFNDLKQALDELAFCHYPVNADLNGKEYVFMRYTDAESCLLKFFKNVRLTDQRALGSNPD